VARTRALTAGEKRPSIAFDHSDRHFSFVPCSGHLIPKYGRLYVGGFTPKVAPPAGPDAERPNPYRLASRVDRTGDDRASVDCRGPRFGRRFAGRFGMPMTTAILLASVACCGPSNARISLLWFARLVIAPATPRPHSSAGSRPRRPRPVESVQSGTGMACQASFGRLSEASVQFTPEQAMAHA